MTMNQTSISSIGEFGLIERIKKIVDLSAEATPSRKSLLAGISDDAAVFIPGAGKVQLLTTDAFVEGVHFDLTFTSMRHLGWKAMVASMSDIVAMGGSPRYATVAISLPKKVSVEMVEEFYAGAAAACKKYSCIIVGGDTTASLANMMVSVAMTGEADEGKITYRKGASQGEYICVTGHLGGSIAGLKVLNREKFRLEQSPDKGSFTPELEPYAMAIEKHLMPRPRADISKILTENVSVGAMIDISDGLASELHHICGGSGTGAVVYERSLPVESVTQMIAREFNELPTQYALFGGEEYELLFTISDSEYEKLEKITGDVTVIGRMTEQGKGVTLVREQGEEEPLTPGGWNHFKI